MSSNNCRRKSKINYLKDIVRRNAFFNFLENSTRDCLDYSYFNALNRKQRNQGLVLNFNLKFITSQHL